MNINDWREKLITNRIKQLIPFMTFPGISFTEYNPAEVIKSEKKQAECMAAAVEHYNISFVCGISDKTAEARALGCKTTYKSVYPPQITETVVDSAHRETAEIHIPQVGSGCLKLFADAVSAAKEAITDRPIFSYVTGPFSVAARLAGQNKIADICEDDPDMVDTLLERVMIFIADYIKMLKTAGADGIILDETDAGYLSPSLNADFSVPYVEKIFNDCKNESFAACYNNFGSCVSRQIGDILTVGADIYNFGSSTDFEDIKNFIPGDVLFTGNNISPEAFTNVSQKEISAATEAILRKCGNMQNFIPSSGCEIPADAKPENISALLKTAEDYYKNV